MSKSNSIKTLKKTSFENKDVIKLQSNLEIVLAPITDCKIIDGTLIKNVRLEVGIRNEIPHKLARKPLGFIIVRKRADSRIWDLQDTNTTPIRTFTLACSDDVTVDIWFF